MMENGKPIYRPLHAKSYGSMEVDMFYYGWFQQFHIKRIGVDKKQEL